MKKTTSRNIEDILALTPMQEGMLFHYLRTPASGDYVVQLILDISGRLDIETAGRAWNAVAEANEMLRARFQWEKVDNPVQVILKEHTVPLVFHDFSGPGGGKEKGETPPALEGVIMRERAAGFNLREEVPFRVVLCRMAPDRHRMVICSHHILYDGWSSGILLKEFFRAYAALARGETWAPVSRPPFKTFIKQSRQPAPADEGAFWEDYLGGAGETHSALPWGKGELPEAGAGTPASYRVSWGAELKTGLENFAREHKLTPAAIIYCAWGLLLQKYNNNRDVIFGTTVSGRPARIKGIEHMVGLFIGTPPLRFRSLPGETLLEAASRTARQLTQREPHETVSPAEIKKHLRRAPGGALYDSILVVENYPLDLDALEGGPLKVESHRVFETAEPTPTVAVRLFRELEFQVMYRREMFSGASVRTVAGHFSYILREILAGPDKKVSDIELITPEEKQRVLYHYNNTAASYPEEQTVHGLFEDMAARFPGRTAVVRPGVGGHLTYGELSGRSGRWARYLREKGVGPGTVVAISAERGIGVIEGILGILKAGAAYLPIDLSGPRGRIEYMLSDVNAAFVLTGTLPPAGQSGVQGAPPLGPRRAPGGPPEAHAPAYVIYTSGSTGRPKGTVVEHRSVVNLLTGLNGKYPFGDGDVYLLKTSLLFDVSVSELFGWFPGGGRLAVLEPARQGEPAWIIQTIKKAMVTHINFVPSMFSVFVEALENEKENENSGFPTLKYIFLAGETLLPGLVRRARPLFPPARLENLYGPTEATVYASAYSLAGRPGQGPTPIGKPLPNLHLYILDPDNHLQPPGVPGQLCITGTGVARGYLNRPELTSERFTTLPPADELGDRQGITSFQPQSLPSAASSHENINNLFPTLLPSYPPTFSLYLTGDLARLLPDGNIEFLGRMDQQVKIRGFRIEPGEIETRLLEHPRVKGAAVRLHRPTGGEPRLLAYTVPRAPGEDIDIPGLKTFLADRLPGYMVPPFILPIAELPLTPGGKIDLNALPLPTGDPATGYTPPRDERDRLLLDLWAQLPGIETKGLGIDTNFFQAGGHSLSAARLSGRVQKAFSRRLPVSAIFKHPTIRAQADYIAGTPETASTPLQAAEEKEYYPQTPAQARLFVLQQAHRESTAYNMTAAMELAGDADPEEIRRVFSQIIREHEALRTSFTLIGDRPVQRIHPPDTIDFTLDTAFSVNRSTGGSMWPPKGARRLKEEDISFKSCEGISGNSGDMPLTRAGTGKPVPYDRAIHSLPATFTRPFHLSRPPLLRVGLSRAGERRFLLMVDLHHIVSDDVSVQLLQREFILRCRGGEPAAPVCRYRDYTEWRMRPSRREELLRRETYWLDRFRDTVPSADLPLDRPRPARRTHEGRTLRFRTGPGLAAALRQFKGERGITPYMLFLAAFNIFLSRLRRTQDIVTGTPAAGRDRPDLEHVMGMFVNTLALRLFPRHDTTAGDFLKEVRQHTVAAFENRDHPFDRLAETLAPVRQPGRNPLFDAFFVMEYLDTKPLSMELPGITVTPLPVEPRTAKFDLTLQVTETPDDFLCAFEYATELFDHDTIRRWAEYFKTLSASLSQPGSPHRELGQLDITGPEEKRRIMEEFNRAAVEIPAGADIVELFEDRARRFPRRTAVVFDRTGAGDDTFMDYGALNRRANRIAALLRQKGVSPNTAVAVDGERCPGMIAAILGILKAGGAYLPVDPAYPAERIRFMLKDSGCGILLTRNPRVFESCFDGEVLDLSTPLEETDAPGNPAPAAGPGDAVYIIYTSGSTGRPKGVMVPRRGVNNLLAWYTGEFGIHEEDAFLLIAPAGFDLAQKNIFAPLAAGGRLCLFAPRLEDYHHLSAFIQRHRVTVINCTPSVFYPLIDLNRADGFRPLASLRYAFLGGERIETGKLPPRTGGFDCQIVNTYGPTECSDVVSYHLLSNEDLAPGRNVPIGRPVPNTVLLVIAPGGALQPVGLAGELYCGGTGMARGYLNRPELTAERFVNYNIQIPNYKQITNSKSQTNIGDRQEEGAEKENLTHPTDSGLDVGANLVFAQQAARRSPLFPTQRKQSQSSLPSRFYATGDLARWLPDGNIQFLGRVDHQVKIRGYRVEPEEIERSIATHPRVKEAAVVPVESVEPGQTSLCAFVTAQSTPDGDTSTPFSLEELKTFLSERLPDYMIPAHVSCLETFPLNPHGKIDRAALALPARGSLLSTPAAGYVAPRNHTEKEIARLWAGVLDIEPGLVGIDTDFFSLGGHSLKAIVLISRLRKQFNAGISLSDLFGAPTVRGLAALVEKAEQSPFRDIPKAEEREYYPLSSAQKRLYILSRWEEVGTGYNMPSVLEIRGRISPERLETSVRRLLQRHETLRTSFHLIAGEPVQKVHDAHGIPVEIQRLSLEKGEGGKEGEESKEGKGGEVVKRFIRPFDLSRVPLFRTGLVDLPGDRGLLLWDMHHITADGTSKALLMDDFAALYYGETPPPPAVRYVDFALWQRRWFEGGGLDSQETYWLDLYHDAATIPRLPLPLDFPRPAVLDFEGDAHVFYLEAPDARRFRHAGSGGGDAPTLYMNLLAAFNVLLYKYTGQEDIITGAMTAGRRRADLQDVAGMFINTLPLRNRPRGETTYLDFLQEVKHHFLDALENQDLPFETLVEKLNLERNPAHHPLFDVCIVLQNIAGSQTGMDRFKRADDIEFSPYEFGAGISQFDMSMEVFEEEDGGVRFRLEYRTRLFEAATIRRFARHFLTLLRHIGAAPGSTLAHLSMLTEEEKQRALADFTRPPVPYPADKSLYRLFEDQAGKTPDRVALTGPEPVFGEAREGAPASITYRRLMRDVENAAAFLRTQKGVRPGEYVGVAMKPCNAGAAVILGILKTGAAYVPIDPHLPPLRAGKIIKDAGIRLVIGNRGSASAPPGAAHISAETLLAPLPGPPQTEPCPAHPLGPAYVLYTSGTTGAPKGVLVDHPAVVNIVSWFARAYDMGPGTHLLQLTGYTFDPSVEDIFSTLLHGAVLHTAAEGTIASSRLFSGYVLQHEIQIVDFVPSLLHDLLAPVEKLPSLRTIIVGGEPLEQDIKDRLSAKGYNLYNHYGPTEVTVDALAWPCAPGPVLLGQAVANMKCLILDKDMQPTATSIPGQLHITGPGIARGYLNQPELTAERFAALPPAALRGPLRGEHQGAAPPGPPTGKKGDRQEIAPPSPPSFYRTGDLVRRLPDGNIQFLGRMDRQVKIRGLRVELQEIEAVIKQHPAAEEALVLPADHPLAAPSGGKDISPALLEDPAALARTLLETCGADQLDQALAEVKAEEEHETFIARTPDFEVSIKLTGGEFILPRGENRRNWTIRRVLEEVKDDLYHLDRQTKSFVRGSHRPTMTREWETTRAEYDQSRLIIDGQQVMQDWERPLMHEMARVATEGHGDVLEIGFGMGISASYMVEMRVRSYTVVECNDDVARFFEEWRKQYPDVPTRLIQGRWEDVADQLGEYDAVFFDTYPLDEEDFYRHVIESITFAQSFFPTAARCLRKGGVFTYYTNEIDTFSRRHQRLVLEHFDTFSLSVVKSLKPPPDCNYWWADSMVLVKCIK